jgi:nickel-dependent lactate racemase
MESIVEVAYGREMLPIKLPASAQATIIRKRPLPVLADPSAAVRQALQTPIGCPSLCELARGRRSACILVCDITRPVPNRLFLRPIIETLLQAGIARDAITILIATGLHRPNEGAELAELIGDAWVLAKIRIENHFARNQDDHVPLGVTRGRATAVALDRRFVQADLRIATGLVEPHFMAGYSGGRKVVAPGIASAETIRRLHSAAFMEDRNARQCTLEGNPLHLEQLEIVAMLGEVYALNTVIDEQRNLCLVNLGEINHSHLAAVEFMRKGCEVPVARRFSTVVTSAAGHPLDKTYYQTVKAMVTPMDILEPGGDLIVASACSEGLGSPDFRASQRRLIEIGPSSFLRNISGKTLAEIDEWQTEMQLKPMRQSRIALYTRGLSENDRPLTGVRLIDSVQEAVAESIERSGDPAVAIIPEGPYVVPFYSPPA